jgi:hypothetical protein
MDNRVISRRDEENADRTNGRLAPNSCFLLCASAPLRELLVLLALSCVLSSQAEEADVSIRLIQYGDNPKAYAVAVNNLSASIHKKLAEGHRSPEEWTKILAVYVGSDDQTKNNRSAILGSHIVDKGTLIFRPRFPLRPGLSYRAVFDPSLLSESGREREAISATIVLPLETPKEVTAVEHVYPSVAKLPENQLKFYLHFTGPMSRGRSYRHIHLLKASGQEVEMPFLELDEELWDADGKRFTLFFDPGRIKRGLKPREEVGPALEQGKSYTLVIDRDWSDARGNPLKESYRKNFQVGPPDDQPLDPKTWKIETPIAGTSKPLVVGFPKPLDHALLGRLIWVVDAKAKRVEGKTLIANLEQRWEFAPAHPWGTGHYNLVVDTALEDLAGNSIGRPFEVDVFHPIETNIRAKTIAMPIKIGSAN